MGQKNFWVEFGGISDFICIFTIPAGIEFQIVPFFFDDLGGPVKAHHPDAYGPRENTSYPEDSYLPGA